MLRKPENDEQEACWATWRVCRLHLTLNLWNEIETDKFKNTAKAIQIGRNINSQPLQFLPKVMHRACLPASLDHYAIHLFTEIVEICAQIAIRHGNRVIYCLGSRKRQKGKEREREG